MAIALEGRAEWRLRAPYHAQLQLNQTVAALTVPSITVVQGEVVRVFRGAHRLKCGERVEFKIWVCQPGEEPTGPAFVYHEQFMEATYVEVYLHGNPPNCELAAHEFMLISAPTDQPSMTVAEFQELALSSVLRQSVPQKKSWWRRLLGP